MANTLMILFDENKKIWFNAKDLYKIFGLSFDQTIPEEYRDSRAKVKVFDNNLFVDEYNFDVLFKFSGHTERTRNLKKILDLFIAKIKAI